MKIFNSISAGLRALTNRARTEREMDEELRAFLEASAAEQRRAGMTPVEAVRAAHRNGKRQRGQASHPFGRLGNRDAKISGRTFATACACSSKAQCLRWLPLCRSRWGSALIPPSSA